MSVIQSLISTSSGKAEPPLMLMCMATCHSLTVIDDVLSGDPLDLKVSLTNMHSNLLSIKLIVFWFIKKMFESTNWVFHESSKDDANKYDNICPTIVTWTPETESNENVDKVCHRLLIQYLSIL